MYLKFHCFHLQYLPPAFMSACHTGTNPGRGLGDEVVDGITSHPTCAALPAWLYCAFVHVTDSKYL